MPIPFNEKELVIKGYRSSLLADIKIPDYSFPVTLHEASVAAFSRKPIWELIEGDQQKVFNPRILPDNVARAFVVEKKPFDPEKEGGGKDMFGIEWEYVPKAGGSMEKGSKHLLEEADEWRDKVVFPDIDSWDWEQCAKDNEGFLSKDEFNVVWIQNGWFERLISFMGFEGAIMAIADEEEQEDVKELLMKVSDTYIKLIDKYVEYFPEIDCFFMHDDWGSQKDTFFSPALCEEVIVPAMRKVTDHIHAIGKFAELHSCGNNIKQVPNMIKAGWDMWCGQPLNDTHKIYDLYGDKIIIGVIPDAFDKQNTGEEEQRRLAREFADHFCRADKPSVLHFLSGEMMTPAFSEELYKQSRINYSK